MLTSFTNLLLLSLCSQMESCVNTIKAALLPGEKGAPHRFWGLDFLYLDRVNFLGTLWFKKKVEKCLKTPDASSKLPTADVV